jgi:hypothetical protein
MMRHVVLMAADLRFFPMRGVVLPVLGPNPDAVFPIPRFLGCPSVLPVFAHSLLDCRQEWRWMLLIPHALLRIQFFPVSLEVVPVVRPFYRLVLLVIRLVVGKQPLPFFVKVLH